MPSNWVEVVVIKKFYHGSATYKCNVCDRSTRDTGDNGSCHLCPQCFELAGFENEISDGHSTREERLTVIRAYVAEIAAKGGNVADWNITFDLEPVAAKPVTVAATGVVEVKGPNGSVRYMLNGRYVKRG